MPVFREEQHFAPWVYVILVFTAVAALTGPLVAAWLAHDPSATIPVLLVELFAGVVVLLPLNLLLMVTEVRDRELVVAFGRWFTMYRKRVPVHDITESRPVYYRPIRDAGGWGIRWGRFEGKRCTFLNVRGDRGVFLVYGSDKRLVVGSQEPERLADALNKARDLQK